MRDGTDLRFLHWLWLWMQLLIGCQSTLKVGCWSLLYDGCLHGWLVGLGIKRAWRRCGLLLRGLHPAALHRALRSPPQSAIAAMEGDPGDPWVNDPGPLITPVDAGTVPSCNNKPRPSLQELMSAIKKKPHGASPEEMNRCHVLLHNIECNFTNFWKIPGLIAFTER